jgi:NADPH2:quinone reductase
MKAAGYEKQGAALDVLVVGEMDDPHPRGGEVRIHVAFSGVNPGDVKKRQNTFGVGMPYPRVIPHSDGSGTVDAVGEGVSPNGSGGGCGATALKVTVLSEPPPSTPLFLWSRWFNSPKAYH